MDVTLSTRARNILVAYNFDLTDLDKTRRKLQAMLMTGIRWRNCGRKTMAELEKWATEPTVQNQVMNERLIELGSISFLESKGYLIVHPDHVGSVRIMKNFIDGKASHP